MKPIARLSALTVVVTLLASASLMADPVIYSQPYSTIAISWVSDASFPDFGQFIADDFLLNGDYKITDVHWWGVYHDNIVAGTDDFTVEFYTDVGGNPAITPFDSYSAGNVTRWDTGTTSGSGLAIYGYSYDLPSSQSLPGGVKYYLSIYNNIPQADQWWGWQQSLLGNYAFWGRPSVTEEWGDPNTPWQDLGFELTGTAIPEPLTSLLFGGSVLAGLLRLRRRT